MHYRNSEVEGQSHWFKTVAASIHLSQRCILHTPPYFRKIKKIPSISAKLINSPISVKFTLLGLIYVFASIYFDHDAFRHHAWHVAYWTPLQNSVVPIEAQNCGLRFIVSKQRNYSVRHRVINIIKPLFMCYGERKDPHCQSVMDTG